LYGGTRYVMIRRMTAIHFSSRTKTWLVWGIVLLALAFLFSVRPIVTPFIWAFVTAYILNAAVVFAMRRAGGPRWVWAILIYFGLVAGLIWLITAVAPVLVMQIQALANEVPNYLHQFELFSQTNNLPFGMSHWTAREITANVDRILNEFAGGLGARAPELARDAFDVLLKLLLYLIATFSMLLQADRFTRGVRRLFSTAVLTELDPWFKRINSTLGSYLRGQALLIGIVSTATFIGLELLGVRFAVALAIMSGLVETIPYLGPYAAGAIAVLVAMTQTQPNNFGWPPLMLGLAVAILYTVIRQAEDYLVVPFVIGRTVELPPLLVLFVVLAGASIAGILGLLLAVPVAAVVKIVLEYLWQKIKEPDPRQTLAVSETTSWDLLARRVRNAPGHRLLLVVPRGIVTPALESLDDYRRLVLLAGDQGVDVHVITDDAAVAANARSVGLVVDEQAAPQFARTATATGVTAVREAAQDLAADAAAAPTPSRGRRPEPAPGEPERKGESFSGGRRPEPPPPVRP
jgi:predicted PurR-regulated permease PerM